MSQFSEIDDDLRLEYDFTKLLVVARGPGRKKATVTTDTASDVEERLLEGRP